MTGGEIGSHIPVLQAVHRHRGLVECFLIYFSLLNFIFLTSAVFLRNICLVMLEIRTLLTVVSMPLLKVHNFSVSWKHSGAHLVAFLECLSHSPILQIVTELLVHKLSVMKDCLPLQSTSMLLILWPHYQFYMYMVETSFPSCECC